uniref:Uncharacterized protein n=1 Tax=Oryza glumipatula TaxID=40148 RepID=A0A0D9YQ72_9ORYZ
MYIISPRVHSPPLIVQNLWPATCRHAPEDPATLTRSPPPVHTGRDSTALQSPPRMRLARSHP